MVKQSSPISEDKVREALDSLVSPHTRLASDHPLCMLLMVDVFLTNPALPRIENAREFAVHQLLVDLITKEYIRHRAIFGLSSPLGISTFGDAIQEIRLDLNIESPELMAWCLLYFVYVRVDFNLSLPIFSERLGLVSRTMRRYRENAISKLTTTLIHCEWKTRIERYRKRLESQLPETHDVHLIERDMELQRIIGGILEKKHKHIIVTGSAGIGKSTLVQESIRSLITLSENDRTKAPKIEHVIWINNPTAFQEVVDIVTINICVENTQVNIREYLNYHTTVIVLDNTTALTTAQIDELLSLFNPAIIFVICNEQILITHVDLYLTIHELTYNGVKKFVEHLTPQHEQLPYSTDDIYHRVGGNPLGIKLFVNNPRIEFNHIGSLEISERIITDTLQSLTNGQYHLCKTLALFPDKLISANAICDYLDGWCDPDNLYVVLKKHLLNTRQDDTLHISLLQIVRRHFEALIIKDGFIYEFIAHIESQLDNFPVMSLRLITYLLRNYGDVDVDIGTLARKLRQYPQIIRSEEWYQLLNSYFSKQIEDNNTDLSVDYAVALRRYGKWSQCHAKLKTLIQYAGRRGDFELQARAMLELVTLLRLSGQYTNAKRLLDRCRETVDHLEITELHNRFVLERSQIEIDKGNGHIAKEHLEYIEIHERTQDWYLLMAEAELLENHHEDCHKFITKRISNTFDRYELGRLYNLLSRNFIKQQRYDEAEHYAKTAISYLDDGGTLNSLALARSKSNLGAILIHIGKYDEAEVLLQQAENTQHIYNDRLALQATRYNLRLLH